MIKVSLFHPFSAKAIGLSESDILFYHSKPHTAALKSINDFDSRYCFTVDYFTSSWYKKEKKVDGVIKRFWTISDLTFNKHRWRRQASNSHYNFYKNNTPDITLINMSGHGSPYVFKLAKLIKENKKNYIAMIGGLHMAYNSDALDYYKNAHHILVHTNFQKEDLLKKEPFSHLDIRVLPLGIDTNIFKPNEKVIDSDHVISYVGRISRLKQVELAIKAVAFCIERGLKNTILNIIGPVSDPVYHRELINLAKEYKCQNNVYFLGSLTQENLITYYQKSTLLVLPSVHESFGIVIIEAMACGVPVVALKGAGGPDDIITNKADGILTTKNLYASEVLNLLKNDDILNKMSINACKTVKEHFSFSKTVTVLHDSLNSVKR